MIAPLYETHEIYSGKYSQGFTHISPKFVFMRNAEMFLDEIKDLYMFKYCIFDMMGDAPNYRVDYIRSLARDLEYIEQEIQKYFRFEPNLDYFRFWEMPKCSCPVMDNQDMWGTKYKIYSDKCIIHGSDLK